MNIMINININLNFCVSDGETNTEEQWIQEIHVLDRI